MTIRLRHVGLLAMLSLCAVAGMLHAQVNVTTYHNDTSRTGQNTQETILTPANVNSTQFGKLFSVPLDGTVYAQPLYLSGAAIAGGTHNVLYVATENDSIYAIDADSGALYAQVSLIPAGGSPVDSNTDLGCTDLVTKVGITGTPVIDPKTGTLYVVAASKINGAFYQYLHALDVATLTEKLNGPVSIQATVPGTGYDSSGGSVVFSQLHENQRPALLLTNGHVVIGWSSHCDYDPWHGWVMSYNASTLAQEAVFNTSPNGSHGGVWMSGGGPAVDTNGNIYFATGNGLWNGNADYGDSIVKLGPPANNNFPVLDYFTPYNQATLNDDDLDISSGGLVMLPTLPSGQQLLAQQGKDGTIYLLNINNLGKYCVNLTPACTGKDPQIVQEIVGASSGIWGSPAYWNGYLYWAGANDSIHAYSLNANNSGLLSTSATSKSAKMFAFAAPTPAISSNGNTNAILWALDSNAAGSTCASGTDCLSLYAYDATNLANLLYTSIQAANNRDSPGNAVKFQPPVIVNGHVYVATQNSVVAYGLLTAAPQPTAVPTFTPAAGTYASAQSVTITDATPGAAIYYTTNGTTPTASSPAYTGAIAVSTSETLQAIAVASGHTVSAVGSASYAIDNGSTTTVINDPTGFSSAAGLSLVGATVTGGAVQLTTTVDYDANATWFATPVNVQNFTTDFNFQISPAGANIADGFTFTIQNQGAQAVGHYGGGLGYEGIGTSVAVKFDLYSNAGEGTDSTGFYTNGALPTLPAIDMTSSGVNLHSGDILHAHITYNGTTLTLLLTDTVTNASFTASTAINIPATVGGNTAYVGFTAATGGEGAVQRILNWTFVVNASAPAAAVPTFTPAAGTYASAQSVTIADATPGATIHYTTNGTTPTASSPAYTGAIAVSTSETLQAIAVASGYTPSAVGSASYAINNGSTTTVINDPTGFSSAAGLSLVGATVTGGAVQLTTAVDYDANATWFATPVNVQNFTTDFNFQISPAGANIADGFTFTIQNQGAQAVGHYGGGLGYEGIGTSVAVKFDLYSNAGEGTDSTGFYTNGATPTVPAIDMTSSGVNLHSGDILHAHITYNGTTLTLLLTDTVTNASFTASTAINIPATVGGNTAYVGFTAATGGEGAVQRILNWTFVVNASAPAAAVPTFTPAAGTYASAQSVTIADATPGATIHYTTDGTTPTASSPAYTGAIAVSTSETLQAIAVASGHTVSAVGSAAYTIGTGSTTVVNDPTGFSSAAGLSLVGATVTGGAVQLTTAVDYDANATWFATPVNVQNFTTDFNFQISPAGANIADGFTFTIQNQGSQAVGHYGGGLGYEGIGTSVAVKFDLYSNAGEGTDSTGFYTNGATPTVPAIDMTSSGVNLHSGDILHAHITYNGTALTLLLTDTVTNASFTASTAINIPATVGGDTAYVGFTAATGGEGAVQRILNWTFVVN